MVAVQSPLIGMQMDADAAQYIAVLERRIAALSINELKFMAVLERASGKKWDTMVLDFEQGNLDNIAIQVIQKQLGCDDMTARRHLAEYKRVTGDANLTMAQKDAIANNPQVAG